MGWVSKPLPLARYKIIESRAADFYGLDKTPIEVEIEHIGHLSNVIVEAPAVGLAAAH